MGHELCAEKLEELRLNVIRTATGTISGEPQDGIRSVQREPSAASGNVIPQCGRLGRAWKQIAGVGNEESRCLDAIDIAIVVAHPGFDMRVLAEQLQKLEPRKIRVVKPATCDEVGVNFPSRHGVALLYRASIEVISISYRNLNGLVSRNHPARDQPRNRK
jgi:hypothetical protein